MGSRFLLAGLLALWVGCGRSSTSPSPPGEGKVELVPGGEETAVGTALLPSEPASPAASDAEIAAALQELTQVVRKFSMEQRRVPKTVEELVAGGYLASVPQAPVGKRFAISKDLQVYLADQ